MTTTSKHFFTTDQTRMKWRINHIIQKEHKSMNKFCQQNGFNRANLINWLKGKKDLKLSTYFKLLQTLEISLTMFDQHNDSLDIIYKTKNSSLCEEEKAMQAAIKFMNG